MSKKKLPSKRNQRRDKQRRGKVDKTRMNEGGFYEGMPGAHVEEYHEDGQRKTMRKMLTFVVTEDGDSKAQIFAPPQLIKVSIREAMKDNVMVRQIVMSAAVDRIFSRKTPWNWIIKMSYKRWYLKRQRKFAEAKSTAPKP